MVAGLAPCMGEGGVGMFQFFKAALLRLAMQATKVGQQALDLEVGQQALKVEQPTQHTHRVVVQMTLQLGWWFR